MSWHGPAEDHQTQAYQYAYDAKYQMLNSSYGRVDLQSDGQYAFAPQAGFAETILGYDRHGNIEGLRRSDRQGNLTADFGYYQYRGGTNQLSAIRQSREAPTALRSYTYNAVGQLTSSQQAGLTQHLQYDGYGQVVAVYADALHEQPRVRYAYDDRGQRVLKQSYSEQSEIDRDTWYVRDASGSVLSVYEQDYQEQSAPGQVELPVYGSSRLGMLSTRGSDQVYQYELKDHLGSVRAVIARERKADGSVDVLHYQDYYAFGSAIKDPDRRLGSYRYGYQGQYAEADEETGWNSFELRQYDSEIGRWLSVDPYGQYASPYVGMGNSPVNVVDPSGGWGYGTSLAITAGAAAAGYGIDRALGGDGSVGFAIGLFAGATVGHIGIANEWSIQLPKVNWSGAGQVAKVAVDESLSVMGAAARQLASQRAVPTNVNLPTSEVNPVPEPRGRSQVLNSPVGNAPISSPFGVDRTTGTSPHIGTDYDVPTGTPVVATAAGTVVRSYLSSTYGNAVIIDHGPAADGDGNVYTLYAHGNSRLVQAGQEVNIGDEVILSGNTGRSTSPHLHYEVIRTNLSPHDAAFFRGIDIRFAPEELGGLLGR